MNTIISDNISENRNRVINAVMSDSQLAKHVTDCEIKQYCLYAYTDTNRNTFGKAMQRVLDAHGEWFSFAAFFGNQKPCICFDLTGEAYHLLNDTVAETSSEITEAEGIKVGDKVRHNKHEEVATVTAIREAFVNGCDVYRYLYTLDFGQSVKGPFDVELNGGEFLREAFTVVPDYYSEYQKLGHQEARPQEWLKKTTNEKRATYYRACVELERMAGDLLPGRF